MKKCLLIVNSLSGNYRPADTELICGKLRPEYDITTLIIPCEDEARIRTVEYDLIVVSGGDGTLNRLLNDNIPPKTEVRYYPSGTLNETADKRRRKHRTISMVGEANDKLFSYVLAAGTFTPLGYVVDSQKKQRFKSLAYIARVVREYKVNQIHATITADGVAEEGPFTLIMIINSPRCFGFRFNRMYKEEGPMCLLAVKAPRSTGLWGKIKIFFPFFRAFFMGFNKPYISENLKFGPFKELKLSLSEPITFCADGEALSLPTEFTVATHQLNYKITVCDMH